VPPLAGPQRARYASLRESGEHGCDGEGGTFTLPTDEVGAAAATATAEPGAAPPDVRLKFAPADVHGAGQETEKTGLEAVCVWSHQAECVEKPLSDKLSPCLGCRHYCHHACANRNGGATFDTANVCARTLALGGTHACQ